MSLKNLKSVVQNYLYVSFDIFDTLIFRTVKDPEDIFDLVESRYNIIFGNQVVRDFRKQRIKAERMARSLNNHREITINRIYELLPYKTEIKNRNKRNRNKKGEEQLGRMGNGTV